MIRICPEASRNFRLIVLLREPVDRSISLHQMRARLKCKDQNGPDCPGIEERLGKDLADLQKIISERGHGEDQ